MQMEATVARLNEFPLRPSRFRDPMDRWAEVERVVGNRNYVPKSQDATTMVLIVLRNR